MDPGNVDVLLHHDVRFGECLFGNRRIPNFPVEDVVVSLARLVGPQYRRIRQECLEGVNDDGKLLVLDVYRRRTVSRNVPVCRNDGRNFLRLVHHLVDRQHHLGVGHQGRHPVKVVCLQILAGYDREDPRDCQCL